MRCRHITCQCLASHVSRVSHVLPCIDAKTKQLQLSGSSFPAHAQSDLTWTVREGQLDGTTSNRTPVSSAIVIDRLSFLLRLATMTGRSLSPPRPFGPPTSKHRHRQVPCRLLIDSCQLSNLSCHPLFSPLPLSSHLGNDYSQPDLPSLSNKNNTQQCPPLQRHGKIAVACSRGAKTSTSLAASFPISSVTHWRVVGPRLEAPEVSAWRRRIVSRSPVLRDEG